MTQPMEKPWLKNKNHLDRTENAPGKKAELLVFDFGENDDPEPGSSPRKKVDETTPRKSNDGPESNRSPRQEAAGDKVSPRGPAADDRSPRNEQGSPRKGDQQAETRDRRAAPQRDGYEADVTDSNGPPAAPAPGARRGRDQSPEKREQRPAAEMNGRKPKPSDASPRPPQPYERTARNTFTGKSTLSL